MIYGLLEGSLNILNVLVALVLSPNSSIAKQNCTCESSRFQNNLSLYVL